MTSQFRTLRTRLASSVALAIGLLVVTGPSARADAYAYSQQTLKNFVLSVTPTGALSTSTGSAASLNGSGSSHNDPTDTLQTFVGDGSLNPGENKFIQAGALGSNTFARGDAQWDPTFNGGKGSISTVAEGAMNTYGTAAGSSDFNLTATLTLTSAQAVTLSFDWLNSLRVDYSGTLMGLAAANFDANFTVVFKNSSGTVVFDESPKDLNKSFSLIAAGSHAEMGLSGSILLTTATLAADTYTATITGGSQVSLEQVVPEPASMIMMGLGAASAIAFAARRSRRTASKA